MLNLLQKVYTVHNQCHRHRRIHRRNFFLSMRDESCYIRTITHFLKSSVNKEYLISFRCNVIDISEEY